MSKPETTDIVERLDSATGDLFQDAAEEIKRLRGPWTAVDTRRVERAWAIDEALRDIARMAVFPDDKINRVTLATAIRIAKEALHD